MPAAHSSSIAIVLLAALVACERPTALADQVTLEASPVASRTDTRAVNYRFSLTNGTADTLWVPACARRVTPDVAFVANGRTVDTTLGSLCLAIHDMSPVPIAPGQSYGGEREVPFRAGARYVPSLTVARARDSQGGTRIHARAFDAP